jgi:hypothetical protein
MVRFKNFECMINVGHVPLPEYTDPDDAGDREGLFRRRLYTFSLKRERPFQSDLKFMMVLVSTPIALIYNCRSMVPL